MAAQPPPRKDCYARTAGAAHKEELGHWSDCELASEEDEEEVEEELQEMIAQLQHNLVIEQQQTQETTFGPPTDKSLLLCHQF